nr:hypothetical protein HmN_000871100 [Hymenolepis microstoma]CUU99915.1 hypothetical transcript [Hymenolepis microstoma]
MPKNAGWLNTESLSLPQNPLADNEVQLCTKLLGHFTKADISPDQMRLLVLESINVNYPVDQWLQVFTNGSQVENHANVGTGVYSELFTFFAATRHNRSAFEGEIGAIKIALGQLCGRDTNSPTRSQQYSQLKTENHPKQLRSTNAKNRINYSKKKVKQ